MFRSSDRRSYSHKSRFAAFLASTALISNSIFANVVLGQALPTGGQVAAGSATINAPSNGAMTINQNSNSAIINWQSFNIGQSNSVTFIQPDASSAILNRVTGSTSTTIAGALNANGQVYLVNPNGIAITSTGTINTGAFVASTLGISDEDFMSGKRTFTGNGASAPVTNAGTITINRGGYMALIGGTVANSGVINVPMGKVALGSGEQATLDISGDGFLQVAIPTKAEGTNPLVSNSGRISARGGTVQLSAAAARDMARQAINMSGTIEARGVAGKSGDITLFGGDGEVAVSGRLNARNTKGTGGKITVTGRKITLAGAKIDASGRTGGGTINIGGERQGKGTLKRAETLSVDANTVIKADAIKRGNGGNIVLWSDNLTNFAGTITARGGADGGNGGEVEVSGKEKLVYNGFTDLSAPKGSLGNLLLDPYNVVISNGTDTSGFTASGDDSVINVNTLITALSAANVTVSTGSSGTQAGTITVADPLSWASAGTLTLNAASDININAAINAPSGGLSLTSGGTISATAGVNVGTFVLNAGDWVQNNGTLPSFYAKDFQINGGSFLRVTGGYGTSANPYQLTDIYGLQGVGSSSSYLQGYWTLANDIDASGTVGWNAGAGFNPIGGGLPFQGSLDGGGHVISNLTINRPSQANVGLFAQIDGYPMPGALANIGLSGGSITGGDRVGGLVGYIIWGQVSNAWSSANVTGGSTGAVGGLIGYTDGETNVSSSYATGTVIGGTYAGGLIGQSNSGSITQSYATGTVSSSGNAGGLVGSAASTIISRSYATGAVTAGYAGGLVGLATNANINQSYATGSVSASVSAGGLVSQAQSTSISQSYATGSALAYGSFGYAGGLIGSTIMSTVDTSYATGAVSAPNGSAGGLIGQAYAGTLSNSYFDIGTTGRNAAIGLNQSFGPMTVTNVVGLTTAQARTQSSYAGWDFNSVWYQSGDMRPILRSEAANAGSDGYIPISNLHQLALMGANQTANYKLTTDLDASATAGGYAAGIWSTSGWVPIAGYYGLLDGQNHTISNLYINRPSTDNVGLFSGIAGWNTPYPGIIRNIGLVGGSITGRSNVGALVGVSDTATITNAWSSANVTGNGSSIGGLVGFNYWTTISNSYASGTVTGNTGASDIGGLVGLNQGVIARSYATGAVTAISSATDGGVGGLVGFMQSNGRPAEVNTSYATGNVTASGGAAGTQAGGLVGRMISATVNQSYATGNVSSTATGALSNSGGLVGRAQSSTVNRSYATGSAYSANGFAAGLVGYLITNGVVNESYATGYVNGGNGSGGLVGYIGFSSVAQNSYFDVNTTGRSNEVSYNVISTVTNVVGLNTAQARVKSSYAGWDFNSVWYQTGDMRPILRSEAASADADGYVAISNLHQLALMGANVGGQYKLVADINASATAGSNAAGIWSTSGWLPVGDIVSGMFTGTFDGQNHTIANLSINRPGMDGVGLFGTTYYGTIRNVGLVGGSVTGNNAVGALVGNANNGSFQNVYAANVTVSGNNNVGGLLGISNSAINGAYATGNVSGNQFIGGLIGIAYNSITNVYATGNVSGSQYVGGLIGQNQATVGNAYASGLVTGTNGGGLAGMAIGTGSFANSFWNIQTSGRSNACGVNNSSCTATGLTTTQMRDPFTFIDAGWDFASVWATPKAGGAPVLRSLTAAPIYSYYARLSGNLSTTYGDVASPNGISLQGAGVNNLIVNWGSAIGGSTNVGTYAWNGANVLSFAYAKGSASDYYITYGTGALTVTPRTITVAADAQSKSYGDANPSLTYTATGLVNNDTLSGGLSTSAGQFSGVGTYAINQGSLSASNNYILNYTGADLSVTPKVITVTADGQSKVYGDLNPSLTYTATGLVNNDTLSGALSTNAAQFSSVGTYAIDQGSLSASSNYTIAYTGADLSVTPRTITVTADAQSKVYGDLNPSLTYTATGLVNNDTLSGALSTSAGQFSGVGAYAINQGNLSASSNYTIAYTGADLSITPKAITVVADGQSKVYGDVNPPLTYTATGLVNNDTLSGALSTNAAQFSGVGTYAINQGSLDNANYTITYTGADLSITPKAITVSADAQSKVYGDVNPSLTYVATGLVNNDTLSGSLSTNAAQFSGVGTYAINRGSLDNANYTITYTGADLSVTPKAITVAADAQSKVYGDVNPSLTYVAAGLVNNDTLSGALSTNAAQFSGVGAYVINQGTLANANYTITYTGADLSITPKAITVAADAQTKVYGDLNPSLTYTATGLVNNDTLTGALSTSAGQFSGVGTYAINQGSLVNANYTITYTGADLSVTPKAITVAADAQSKVYGDANPSLTYIATGLVNNDTLSGALSTSAGQFSSVGAYAINQGSLANANYSITYTGADLSVTPKAITVAADAQSKVYGDLNPSLTYTASGLVNNDTLSGSLSTSAGQFSGVGAYAINQGSLANANYSITYTGADLSITPKAITVAADAQSKTYGDFNPSLTYTATGLVNNDTLSGGLETSAGQFSNVGAYAINQGTLANANYVITYTGANLSVTPKTIIVAADAQSKAYGDVNPSLTYVATGLVNNDTLSGSLETSAGQFSGVGSYIIERGSLANANYNIVYLSNNLLITPRTITVVADAKSRAYGDVNPSLTYTATGLVNNDTLSGSLETGAVQFTNVGNYAINIGSLGNANYNIVYTGADLSITPRTLTVTADAQSKVYGDVNPSLTYTATGLVANDTLSGSLSTSAGQFSGVGAYAINQGSLSASSNYTITYTGADLSITPKAITVAADAQSKVYGDVNPSLTYVATGLVNNDTLSGSLSTSAGQFSGVGVYAINRGSLDNANYTITYTGADLSITPKAITVAADAQTKIYGDFNPSLTYIATGLVNNDTLSGALSTSAGQFSGVGAYAINQGTLANANYTITYTGADLSITPKAITVAADAQSKVYGDLNPSLAYVATGLVNNDTLSGSLSTSASQFSGVGTYAINRGSLDNANYTITYTGADLSITPKAITVAADAQTKIYGDLNPSLTYVATGLVNNDTLSGALSTSAGQFSGVGAYAINRGSLDNANYSITYTGADLSITPKAITVAADAQSKVYGDVNPSLTYVATGLVNNDTLSGALSTSAGQFSGVGTYAINRGSLDNANYTITYTGADLSITPKAITVAADALSKVYGDVNPSLTYVATGLVNNDTLSGALSTSASQFSSVGAYAINQGTLANANYTITYTGADLSITPKAITVAADAQSKVYGDLNPSLTYTATGLINNDTLTGALSTSAGQFSNVGTYAINQGTLANANYSITYTGADLSVTPKAITVAADAQSKVYGDINPSLTYLATGLVNNDTLSGALSTNAVQFSGVGTYAINQGTLANANYTITYTGADLSVTPKAITVAADTQSRVYGDVNPALTYVATGLVNNDTLSGALSTSAGQFSGVGTYGINQGTLANANYTITYTGADLSITPKAITVAADAQSKVYGDLNPSLTYTASGLVNNDTLSGALSTNAAQFSGVGTYAINQGTLANANYTITYTGADLSITPKAITVAADAQTKIYGDLNPSLTYVATGLVNNDTLSGALSTSAGQFSGVGAYAINQGTLVNANYSITYTGADLSITPKAITVAADAQSKVYGDVNPSLTYVATGLVNNDTLSGALSTSAGQFSGVGTYGINQDTLANANYSITYTGADLSITPKAITVAADAQSKVYGDVNPSLTYVATGLVNNDTLSGALSTNAAQFSGVGTYGINQGTLANANYSITYTGADLSITPKAITVAADAQSKVYGDLNPSLTYMATGLVNNDTLTGALSTSAGQFSNVGTYAINQGTLANANYSITYTGADLSITPKAITVAADAQSKVYGDVNPSLTYVATGLVNNDTLTGALSTSAGQFSGVGTYAINQGSLSASSNYTVTYTGADLSITPKAITVAADAQSKVYGDVNPSLTYTATGLVNNDTLSGALSTSAGQFSGVGAYVINQGTLANANYTITYTGADLSVTPKPITVVADAQSKIYGETNPSLTYTATGLVNNDTLSGTLSTSAGQFSGVGTYAINQGTLANANYAITYTGANLTVNPRDIIVIANSASRTAGAANPALTYTVGGAGLVNGDTLFGSLATSATSFSEPGEYAIAQGTLAASANYRMSFIPGVLTVKGSLSPDPGTLAGSIVAAFDAGRSAPIQPVFAEGGEGNQLRIADPRFDGTLICLEGQAGCRPLLSQARP